MADIESTRYAFATRLPPHGLNDDRGALQHRESMYNAEARCLETAGLLAFPVHGLAQTTCYTVLLLTSHPFCYASVCEGTNQCIQTCWLGDSEHEMTATIHGVPICCSS